jgi:hypothetical protein
MTRDSTPRHDLTPEELEVYLRDSHVAIKETLRARGELEPGGEAARVPARLRLVANAADEDDADQAKLVELRARRRSLVDAERTVANDGAEAKFHRRREIAEAVQAVRDSCSVLAVAAPRRSSSVLRKALLIAGVAAVVASLALGLELTRRSASPGSASPHQAAGTLPLPVSAVKLDLRGVPTGASIRLDGAPVRGTTVAVDADGQAHTLAVDAAGYRRWSVTLAPAADRTIPVDLSPQPTSGESR